MRKVFLSFAAALAVAGIHQTAQAQAPARFNYQGIARAAGGVPIANQAVSMRISILDGSSSGTAVFVETQNATTNAYGLYNVTIGGGTAVTGTLAGVNFASGSKFIQVELDPAGGSSYTNLGATQLLSVPYAMHSASAASAPAPTLTLTGNSLSAGGNSVTLPSGSGYTAGTGIGITGSTISATNTSAIWNASQLQGVAVSATAPTNGQALVYNGTAWAPSTVSGGGVSGTQNYISKFATATSLGNSQLFDNGTLVGLGTTSPTAKLHINAGTTDSMGIRIASSYSSGAPNGLLRVDYNGTNTTTATNGIMSIVTPSTTVASGRGMYGAGGNVGVQGRGLANTGNGFVFGMYADAYSEDTAIALYGFTDTYASPTALGQKYGVYGIATYGVTNYGVYGIAGNGTTNWAGYFAGNVNVTGSIAKASGTFKIDHPQDPENKYLYHSFVESPDMMNIYNGNVTTDAQGNATVTLPAYFDALNKDFRYQLTPIGTFAQAIVAEEISGNSFIVKTDKPGVKVSWQVTGVRRDKWAEAHRVVPEVAKPEGERGKYMHAAEWGKDESAAIDQPLKPSRKRGQAPSADLK